MFKKLWEKLNNKNEATDKKEKEYNQEDVIMEDEKEELHIDEITEESPITPEEIMEEPEMVEELLPLEKEELEENNELEKDNELEEDNALEEEPTEKINLFARLKEGLSKTKKGITDKVDILIKSYQKIDEELFEELEEILITADIGVNTTMEVIDELRDAVKVQKITQPEKIKELLQEKLTTTLNELSSSDLNTESSPSIILVVGVNGVGKTTSIGKIAYKLKGQGKKVLLAAGDTFRAAAIDQLKIWGDRVGVDVIKHQEGSDPAAVIYDAIQAAKARKMDVLICDTAGRLHNKKNLMNELGKVFKVVEREFPQAVKEVLLVLDATTGQNAIQQAKTFKEVANISGLVLTKLDGTAKGGIVIAISKELNIPVKLIGVGEKMEDLQEFNASVFVKALFGEE
ncbi:signal recognition particle-docking protein FtsY [Natronincola peptidivorans]|uniref:Signal recognition particle receptor FtsY n=1 Tax=Natronincola peptidivorans TaxID=426128 RepID=A0A1H9YD34_9FIRM|nr:signal recognition particle-docking protein FtsY [Natronincola peptidivorans]SES66840.1 signal recognition particle-docking protein FtsY [Natronincola peptidivorans]